MAKNRTVIDNLPVLAREIDFITQYLDTLPADHKFTDVMLDDLEDLRHASERLSNMVVAVFEELEGK